MTAAAAVNQLASGEPPINFAAHQFRAGNISGAREDFEQMLAMLVAAVHPGARLIAANPGDWGIDVLVGDLSGVVVIWQAKYFWPAVTRAKQAAIRDSFGSAVASAERNGYRVRQWVLCVPSSMDAPTAKWWDSWRVRKQRETGVVIDVWHETVLRSLLITPDAAHVRRHFYDPYAPHVATGWPAGELAGELAGERAGERGGERAGEQARPPVRAVGDEAAAVLERALFVRQLRAAGHAEVEAAKREFFNAELLAREVTDKGVPAELDALAEAAAVVHGIWEAGFNAACQRSPADPRLPGLHTEVMHEIRESAAFPPVLPAGPVHRCGMLHRVVDDGRAGWVVHWRDIAAAAAAATAAEAGAGVGVGGAGRPPPEAGGRPPPEVPAARHPEEDAL